MSQTLFPEGGNPSLLKSLLMGLLLEPSTIFNIDRILLHPAMERSQLCLTDQQKKLRFILRQKIQESIQKFRVCPYAGCTELETCLTSIGIELRGFSSPEIVSYFGEIFNKGLKLSPFLSVRNIIDKGPKIGANPYVYQLQSNKPQDYWSRSTPQLEKILGQSLENERLYLADIPKPLFCILVPREGEKFRNFPFIYPNLRLDLNPILPPPKRSMVQSANALALFAIICEKNGVYSTFVRKINMDGSSKWVYYDSVGSQVLEVIGLSNLFDDFIMNRQSNQNQNQNQRKPNSVNANVNETTKNAFNYLLNNGFVYFYCSPTANQNQLCELDYIQEKNGIPPFQSYDEKYNENTQFGSNGTETQQMEQNLYSVPQQSYDFLSFTSESEATGTGIAKADFNNSESLLSTIPNLSFDSVGIKLNNGNETSHHKLVDVTDWTEKWVSFHNDQKSSFPSTTTNKVQDQSQPQVVQNMTPQKEQDVTTKIENWLNILMMTVFAETSVFHSRLLKTVCTFQPLNFHGLELRHFFNDYVNRNLYRENSPANREALKQLHKMILDCNPSFDNVRDLRGVITCLFEKCLHLKGFLEFTTGNDGFIYLHALNMDRLRFNRDLCPPIKLLFQQSFDSQGLVLKRVPEPCLIFEIRQTSPDVSVGVFPNMTIVVKCSDPSTGTGSTFSLDLHALICRSREDTNEYSVFVRHRTSRDWLHKNGVSGEIRSVPEFSSLLRDHELKLYKFEDFPPLLQQVTSSLYMCVYILSSRFE